MLSAFSPEAGEVEFENEEGDGVKMQYPRISIFLEHLLRIGVHCVQFQIAYMVLQMIKEKSKDKTWSTIKTYLKLCLLILGIYCVIYTIELFSLSSMISSFEEQDIDGGSYTMRHKGLEQTYNRGHHGPHSNPREENVYGDQDELSIEDQQGVMTFLALGYVCGTCIFTLLCAVICTLPYLACYYKFYKTIVEYEKVTQVYGNVDHVPVPQMNLQPPQVWDRDPGQGSNIARGQVVGYVQQ